MKTSHLLAVICVQLLNLINLPTGDGANSCQFTEDKPPNSADLVHFNRLKPLFGKRYKLDDPVNSLYTYHIGICTPAIPDKTDLNNIGAVQIEKPSVASKDIKSYNLGKFTKATIITGSDWVFLEYTDGKPYNSHCSQESRRAVIMITCDEAVSDTNAKMVLLQENNNLTAGCYYLFELSHRDMCPGTRPGNLSLGSIFIIVLFSVIAVYLFFGFLYQRFVLGAKGMEQIPNYGFWQDFGNLQADGCNFVCRSGGNRGPRTYKGVGDDQLEEAEERDDHLLPM